MNFKLIYIFIAAITLYQAVAIFAKLSFVADALYLHVLFPTFTGLFSYFVFLRVFCWLVDNFMNIQ